MKTSLALCLATLVLCLNAMATADLHAVNTIPASNTHFTHSIYKILAKKDGNVFFSPLSIDVMLALAYFGARGSTAQQMAAGLHLPADNGVVKDGYHAMISSIKSDENVTLSVANKIFAEQTFAIKPEFKEVARTSFLADVDSVDFKHEAEAARLRMNAWVENKTNNKIKELVSQGMVGADTALVLVNAIHFKGDWVHEFDPESTRKQKFYLNAAETKDVDTMYLSKHLRFATHAELDCQVLELPYKGNRVSMVIFLPNAVDGLPRLEAKLPEVDLPKLMSELSIRKVNVWLPKFKIEQQAELKNVLAELGMVDMFTSSADFSGIADQGIFVSAVVHKAFIDVNEQGTEAAASTAIFFELLSLSLNPKNFKADHPFIFHIRDNSGALLFVGRLSNV